MSRSQWTIMALAIVGFAAAQCGTSGATTTIESDSDATALASCETYSGSIAVSTGATEITISAIQVISGDLVVIDASNLTTLIGTDLQEIGGEFHLEGLTVLSTLQFPVLFAIQSIFWTALPNLQELSFTAGVDEASLVEITNTELDSLDGLNLQAVDRLIVENNPYLTTVDLPLVNINTSLSVRNNGKVFAVNLPNLVWAYNLTFQDVSNISLPALSSVNESMGLSNDGIESLTISKLTHVGGSLSITSNDALVDVSMPLLAEVGGAFVIGNSSNYHQITFPSLQTIGGALDFYGNISEVQLQALGAVDGAFIIQSTEDISTTCETFGSLSGSSNVIRGGFLCAGDVENPGAGGTIPTTTSTGPENGPTTIPSSGTSTESPTTSPRPSNSSSSSAPAGTKSSSGSGPNVGAIAGGVVGGVVGAAIIASVVFLLVRRKKQQMTPAYPELQRYPAESAEKTTATSVGAYPQTDEVAR